MSTPTVLVTGLNGFVAVSIALKFLQNGWNVRGTVRSASKVQSTLSFPALKAFADEGKLEVVVFEDLATGDVSKHLQGVNAIAHIAAPLPNAQNVTWEQFKTPTIQGAVNLLEQAAHVKSVTAIALMSSMASMMLFKPWQEDRSVITEDSYFPMTEEEARDLDPKTNPMVPVLWYAVAKKLAEKAAEQVQLESGSPYSLARLCPPMIYGPLYNVTKPEEIDKTTGSSGVLAGLIAGRDAEIQPDFATAWVHVDDVAQAFYTAIVEHKSGRYLIASETPYDNQLLANFARKVRPDLQASIPLGKPDEPTPSSFGSYSVDSKKSQRELRIQYKGLEEMVGDVMDYFVKIGAVKT